MTAQLFPNLLYAVLLLVVLLAPYAGLTAARPANEGGVARSLAIAVMGGALVLTILRQGALLPFSLLLLVPLVGLGLPAMLGGIAAVLLFAPVMWWPPVPITVPLVAIFGALALAAAALPRWQAPVATRMKPEPGPARAILLPMLACLIIGLIAGLLTAPFGSDELIHLAWHHWGAYLAPVEAWLSGGVPYRDFPVQYGLGPTALLAASCGADCWRGMYHVAIGANALYFATLAGSALLLTLPLTRGLRWLGLLALFAACFIWTAFPTSLAGPAMTPSVAGLRFLPISALLLHILIAERHGRARDWIGHALWFAALCWSPEGAFFGTAIWWPYLALRDASNTDRPWRALLLGALRGGLALIAGLVALTALVLLIAGRTISPADFLAYIQHPPGPVQANPFGTIWLAIAIVLVCAGVLTRGAASEADKVSLRSLYACLLGLMAAGTYYLSRSHDNNVLNLFPLIVLVLLASFSRLDAFGRSFAQTVLAAIIAFVATVNAYPWADAAARGELLTLGPARLIAHFTPTEADAPAQLSHDAVAGLMYLREHDAGAVMLFDEEKVMPRTTPGTGWTGVNNYANFGPLPGPVIAHYIRQGAAAYRRPGWILVDDAHEGHWVMLFRTAYDVRKRLRFGRYSAYYLVPRLPAAARP